MAYKDGSGDCMWSIQAGSNILLCLILISLTIAILIVMN